MALTATRARLWVAGSVVAVVVCVVLVQGLGNATVYFRTADEAVAQRHQLGDRRFRIEGAVVPGTVAEAGNAVTFAIENKGVSVPVRHEGAPPELFKPGIPVVLEGHFHGDAFDSDRIMVKHSEEYIAKHPERVPTTAGTAPSPQQRGAEASPQRRGAEE